MRVINSMLCNYVHWVIRSNHLLGPCCIRLTSVICLESQAIRPNWPWANITKHTPQKACVTPPPGCLEGCKISALKPSSKTQLDLTINPRRRPPLSWSTCLSTGTLREYYNAINAGSGFRCYTLIKLSNYWPIIQSVASGEIYFFFRFHDLWQHDLLLNDTYLSTFFLKKTLPWHSSSLHLISEAIKRQRHGTTRRTLSPSTMFAGKYRGGSSLQTGGRDRSLQRPAAV